MDYQKTLNLPKTDFPMKAGLVQKEPQILAQWEKGSVYAQIRKKSEGKERFVLHDGPPYANGHIHIGHVLNKVLKDFVVKMKTMQDMDSPYIPGWDCHGLPIEHQLFKELKKKKSEVNTVEFRKKAHDYAMKFVGIQREDFKRLGIFGEWDTPYLTLAPEYEYWILKSLADLTKSGYVYRGLKPVNWCASCETALAEAEVEYEDHTSPSVYVRFQVNNPEKIGYSGGRPLNLLIWTTTPWTLLANVAVAVHPAFKYVFVETDKDVLIMEHSLNASILEKAGIGGTKIIKEVEGKDLTSLVYTHPFGLKENCRVITTDYVTKEDGTGLVHTAPGHGQEDFEAGRIHKLDILMPVDDRGLFTKDGGPFAGQHVFKANEPIIEDLKARGLLLLSEKISHSYPHCWRCKQPVIFRATEQWFLSIDHKGLRDQLKEIIRSRVQWVPPTGEERIMGMVTTRPDWCLSRQRHWGVPIPALLCKGCKGQHKLFPEIIEHFAQTVRTQGSDVWFEKELKDLLPAGFQCPDCKGKEFAKTQDILDVWFDSGVSHQAVARPRLKQDIPLDLYLEGSDQHRGWFQSSLIPATAIFGKAPFKAVLTHGFVVDGLGRKMSKSLGNVISPQEVLGKNGAEILRLWVASSNYHDDIRLSAEIFERLVDAYRKIRNTLRFILGNLHGFDADQPLAYDQMIELDRWALYRLHELGREVKAAYNAYDFAKVYKMIYAFCNEDLSGFYLDILKDRLYTSHALSTRRRSAQTVLYHIFNHLVRMIAPILVFTSDEAFQYMPKDKTMVHEASVHVLNWLEDVPQWNNSQIKEKFAQLFDLRTHVLKALEDKRSVNEIGSSLEAKLVFRTASDRDYQLLEPLQNTLPEIFIVSQVEIRKVPEVQGGVSELFSKTKIGVEKAEGNKCCRCWKHLPDVGTHPGHPELCGPCVDVVRQWEKDSSGSPE